MVAVDQEMVLLLLVKDLLITYQVSKLQKMTMVFCDIVILTKEILITENLNPFIQAAYAGLALVSLFLRAEQRKLADIF